MQDTRVFPFPDDRLSICEDPHPTQRSLWRFSGRLTDPPWNRSLAELVEQISVQRQRSFAGVIRGLEQDRG
jgi:hypothetical protein